MLIVFGVAVVLVIPAIVLLFTLAQRSLVEETAQAPQPSEDPTHERTSLVRPQRRRRRRRHRGA